MREPAHRSGVLGLLRRVGVSIGGVLVVGLGIVLMPLPGPGLVIVVAGLAVLATEYAWARRLLEQAQTRAKDASAASVRGPLRLAATAGAVLALLGLGVAVIAVPEIPYAGISAGIGLIVGGVALAATTGWSLRRQRTA